MSQPIENQPAISQIHTSCKDCAFAIYDNATQSGCEMGMLDRYKQKDTKIIEAYDEEKEFYILDGRKCIAFRKNSWFDQFGADISIEEKKDKVKETFKLKYILLIDLKNFSTEQLEKTIDTISNLEIKPKKIILIRYNYTNKIFDYDYVKDILAKSNLGCPWRLQTMLDETVGLKSIIYNTITTNPQNKYLLYINNHTDKIVEVVEKANNIVFEELGAFTGVSNSDYTAIMFLGLLYRYIWYTQQIDIIESKDNFIMV